MCGMSAYENVKKLNLKRAQDHKRAFLMRRTSTGDEGQRMRRTKFGRHEFCQRVKKKLVANVLVKIGK